jgi:hypothetical protein
MQECNSPRNSRSRTHRADDAGGEAGDSFAFGKEEQY